MFTGLVEELAEVRQIRATAQGAQLELAAKLILEDMALGDSISVNGICLTVVRMTDGTFFVEAVPETMRRTNLHTLRAGDCVHVERAMPAGGRFGGHIVSGHIDGTGRIGQVRPEGMARVLLIECGADLLRYIVEKGSICVDGVSLTVMGVGTSGFEVSIIPHTQGVTRLGDANVGDVVNLECDVIAKYVERLLGMPQSAPRKSSVTVDFLQQHGFA
ncbi:riboflavin synthase [Alicyclobacillus fastidiosus]|uniref:Riboflavin synthase n=1 Tax=Alicyclobacillus fastidiosus TaxID=392011 RepID=A0ABY6ZJ19_9BACL|nr:riboflavin synthase [Alicyclobacillus fastidiosus]WAH42864.1 riboflavin synthase [Alicyclobacillus fastidiosus]